MGRKGGITNLVTRNLPATFRDQLFGTLVDFRLRGGDFVL